MSNVVPLRPHGVEVSRAAARRSAQKLNGWISNIIAEAAHEAAPTPIPRMKSNDD